MSKKSFKDINPVMQFITKAETQETDKTDNTQHTHSGPETKSKRLNLLLYPSIYRDLEKIARVDGVSVNELINSVLDEFRDQRSEAIKRYETIWGKKKNG